MWRSCHRERQNGIPEAKPRVISDNGSQVIARDFKESFESTNGRTQVRQHPDSQNNEKRERRHGSDKAECIQLAELESIREARAELARYLAHDNARRLHSAIDYITSADRLNGLAKVITKEHDGTLHSACDGQRKARVEMANGVRKAMAV